MEAVLQFWVWITSNYLELVALVSALIAVAEAVVRLTPTTADDGAVQRLGEKIKVVMDYLKVPNNLKKPPTEEKKP